MFRIARVATGVVLLLAVLIIFVHPAVDGHDAAGQRRAIQLLLAAAITVGAVMLRAVGSLSRSPACLDEVVRPTVATMLALHCERIC
jgi:hypothetical protein